MSDDLKIGDIVRLKSGGCPMTIDTIERSQALCSWQDDSGEFRSNWFALSSLVSVEEELLSEG